MLSREELKKTRTEREKLLALNKQLEKELKEAEDALIDARNAYKDAESKSEKEAAGRALKQKDTAVDRLLDRTYLSYKQLTAQSESLLRHVEYSKQAKESTDKNKDSVSLGSSKRTIVTSSYSRFSHQVYYECKGSKIDVNTDDSESSEFQTLSSSLSI